MEQVSENVLFVFYRYKMTGDPADKNDITLVASKVRYGETGETTLYYDGDKATIFNDQEDFINADKEGEQDELPF